MISTKNLENAARETEKTGVFEVTFTFSTKAIDEHNITGSDIISMFADTAEGKTTVNVAGQILDTYLRMKRERRL